MKTFRMWIALTFALTAACGKAAPEEEHHEEADTLRIVTLTPQQMATAQIALSVAEQRAVASEIEATAQIEAAPDRTAHVSPRISGRILSIGARVGDNVGVGESLAVIDSPELSRAKAGYVSAATSAALARQVADKERTLFQKGISSEREWRRAESDALRAQSEQRAAETDLHSMGLTESEVKALENSGHYTSVFKLASPIAGHVVEQQGALGQVVEPGFSLFTIMDLREVWIVIDVYEQDLSRVSRGQQVQVRVSSYPDRVFRGTISNVGASLETATRTAKVRVVLGNADMALKPGMFANVTVTGRSPGSAQQSLVVPSSAVQRDAQTSIVFVAVGDRKFQARTIVVGRSGPTWVEVASGISIGDSVVTAGAFLLKSQLRKSQLGASHPH